MRLGPGAAAAAGVIAALLVAVGSGTTAPPVPSPPAEPIISFAILGDVPYSAAGEQHLARDLRVLADESDVEFIVHLGDIKTGRTPCVAAVYESVAALLRTAAQPLFIIPGDNEWNDCADPDFGWQLWTKSFTRFEQAWKPPFEVRRQPGREENFAFERRGVMFVGVNVVGGRLRDGDEWQRRHEDNLRWIDEQLSRRGAGATHAVIFGHAEPRPYHGDFFTRLEGMARVFDRPVLYAHGDGHRWRVGRLVRDGHVDVVQVDDGNRAPPVKVTITTNPRRPFVFDRRLDRRRR